MLAHLPSCRRKSHLGHSGGSLPQLWDKQPAQGFPNKKPTPTSRKLFCGYFNHCQNFCRLNIPDLLQHSGISHRLHKPSLVRELYGDG